jgi:DNA excision repair protein ERCC-4
MATITKRQSVPVRRVEEEEDDDFDAVHLDWSDIAPPKDIVRARRDGHLVKIPKPVLVIDSGESRGGYTFERFSKWIGGTEQRRLKNGDYSISGLERVVTIERKSPGDAVTSVMPPLRAPFLDRCRRMAGYERKAIVIEASYAEMRSSYEAFSESQAHPNAVVGSYLAIQERWGIPVHFIDGPELAEEFVAHLLTKFYVRHWLKKAGMGDHFQDGDI